MMIAIMTKQSDSNLSLTFTMTCLSPGLMSLPVELLEIIFKHCYIVSIHSVGWDASLSDTLRNFPYNLVAVDPSWNAILLRHWNYWRGLSRLVFNVDSKTPTHIDDARTVLQYMFYEPEPDPFYEFHVAIIRYSKVNPDDSAEKERVMNLMNLLVPHLRRVRSFVIDVHASSSLPSVTAYFNNSSIDSLEYLCDLDDSEDTVSNEPYEYGFLMPGSIKSMILDGGTFRRNTTWLRRQTELKSLTISHLSHGASNSANLDVRQALDTVLSMATPNFLRLGCNLKSLKFRDVNFSSCDSMCQAFSIFMRVPNNISIQYLSFEDVDPWFLEGLTRSIFLNPDRDVGNPACLELHLTCGATSRDIPVDIQTWKYARLVLEGYDEAHLTASYPFDQERFLSSELHLVNCSGFTDSALEILSKIDPEIKAPLFSANLKYLGLTDCHGFTIQALKDMVAAHGLSWQKRSQTAAWKNRGLDSLEVSGYGALLSDEDKYWFTAHVKNFSWDGVLFSAFCDFQFLIFSCSKGSESLHHRFPGKITLAQLVENQ